MKFLQLLPIGPVDPRLLSHLKSAIPHCFSAECTIHSAVLDPAPTFHGERQQYHSSEVLQLMQEFVHPRGSCLLGVAAVDLYIPILTFVFGEAQIGGPCAVISIHRLRQEFYGLPPDPQLLQQRLLKEAVHELGHTLQLTHCDDYQCAMAPSHAVEWIDLKGNRLCRTCETQITTGLVVS